MASKREYDKLYAQVPKIVARAHESTGPHPNVSQGEGDRATWAKPGQTVKRDRGEGDQTITIPPSAVTGEKSSFGFDKFAEDDRSGPGHESAEEK